MAMKIAAPPEPPLVHAGDSVKDDTTEALIKEARQRARRRRWIYGGAVVVLAIASVAAFMLPGGPSSPPGAAPAAPKPPTPLGPPLVQGPDAASTLLTSWGGMHVGYVFVYADGRVIWGGLGGGVFFDADNRVTGVALSTLGSTSGKTTIARFWLTESGIKPGLTPGGEKCVTGSPCPSARFPEGEFGYRIIERRLSAHGLEMVREGKIKAENLLVLPNEAWPAEIPRSPADLNSWPVAIQLALRPDLWAEPTTVWEPSTWAITFGLPDDAVDATRALEQLPVSAQAHLTGKQRTCNFRLGNAHWGGFLTGVGEQECFELTAAEFAAFSRILDPNASITDLMAFGPIEVDGRPVTLNGFAMYPHGQPQIWGG